MHPRNLTPGVIDDYAKAMFTGGACTAFALALHDATGWPLVTVIEADNVFDGATGGAGLHYGVQRPDGKVIDIDGAHDPDEWLSMYDECDPDDGGGVLARTSRADVDEWRRSSSVAGRLDMHLVRTFVAPLLASLR